MQITALERRQGQKQVQVHLADGRVISIGAEVCLRFGLHVGDALNDGQLNTIQDAETRRSCLQSALRLLSYRQRSEAELRDRLTHKQVPADVVSDTLFRLRNAGLLDDEAFARDWVESRTQRAPRSRRLVAAELLARGVPKEMIAEAAGTIDERDAAYRAAERRARSLAGLPYADFRQRISGLLLRRGFDYDVVRETVRKLWRDARTPSDSGQELYT